MRKLFPVLTVAAALVGCNKADGNVERTAKSDAEADASDSNVTGGSEGSTDSCAWQCERLEECGVPGSDDDCLTRCRAGLIEGGCDGCLLNDDCATVRDCAVGYCFFSVSLDYLEDVFGEQVCANTPETNGERAEVDCERACEIVTLCEGRRDAEHIDDCRYNMCPNGFSSPKCAACFKRYTACVSIWVCWASHCAWNWIEICD